MKTWLFHWVEGGYNTVIAETRKEALEKARTLGKPGEVFKGLTVSEKGLHVARPGEVEALNRYYAGMFD